MSYPFLSEVRKHFIEIMIIIVVLEFMERDNGEGGGGWGRGAEHPMQRPSAMLCCFRWKEFRCRNSGDIWAPALCPLHISRSDTPIGLQCCCRQIGTKPCDAFPPPRRVPIHMVAEWPELQSNEAFLYGHGFFSLLSTPITALNRESDKS